MRFSITQDLSEAGAPVTSLLTFVQDRLVSVELEVPEEGFSGVVAALLARAGGAVTEPDVGYWTADHPRARLMVDRLDRRIRLEDPEL